MTVIKNIDGEDIVNTTGVSELNENFNSLEENKLEKIEFQSESTQIITFQDKFVVFRPWFWYKSVYAKNASETPPK